MGGGGGGGKKRKVSAIARAEPKTLQQLTDVIDSIGVEVTLWKLELSAGEEGGGRAAAAGGGGEAAAAAAPLPPALLATDYKQMGDSAKEIRERLPQIAAELKRFGTTAETLNKRVFGLVRSTDHVIQKLWQDHDVIRAPQRVCPVCGVGRATMLMCGKCKLRWYCSERCQK